MRGVWCSETGDDEKEKRNSLAALSNLFITASPESVCKREVNSTRSSSVRNFAVSGQSQTQNLATMPTMTVKRPSMMNILLSRISALGCHAVSADGVVLPSPARVSADTVHLCECVSEKLVSHVSFLSRR